MASPWVLRTLFICILAAVPFVCLPVAAEPTALSASAEAATETLRQSSAGSVIERGTAPLPGHAAFARKAMGVEDEEPTEAIAQVDASAEPGEFQGSCGADRDRLASVCAFLIPYETGPPRI